MNASPQSITNAEVSPLLVKVEPIAGESLMSLVVRAAEANVFARTGDLLSHAGITSTPSFAPFTSGDKAGALAALLGASEAEVLARMHPRIAGPGEARVRWAGLSVERRFIEARVRRVSPAALRLSTHHRIAWTHRALTFCPETFEFLISECPRCGQTLGWIKTWGHDRCEHCQASLLDASPGFVAEELRSCLRLATDLIAPDDAIRGGALAALPDPFSQWTPSEVFSAIIELGLAWEHPAERRASDVANALSEGRIGVVTPQALVRGYEIIASWPPSFTELVGRVWQAQTEAGNPSLSLRKLGLLGRQFHTRVATPLKALVGGHITVAALNAGLPLKLMSTDEIPQDTATLTQAQDALGITKKVLRRLVPDGDCVVGAKLGRGGCVTLNWEKAEVAGEIYHYATRPAEAAADLGVPAYCLGAFVECGLLQKIDNPDALRLAGVDLLLEPESVSALVDEFDDVNCCGSNGDEPLSIWLAHQFPPTVWAQTFHAILTGKLELSYFEQDDRLPLSRRIYVERDEVRQFIKKLVPSSAPQGLTVTAETAGQLLGISEVYIPDLIERGGLKAERKGRKWAVSLDDLIDFDRAFVLSPEIAIREQIQRQTARWWMNSEEPEFDTEHLSAWWRNDIKPGEMGFDEEMSLRPPSKRLRRCDHEQDNTIVAPAGKISPTVESKTINEMRDALRNLFEGMSIHDDAEKRVHLLDQLAQLQTSWNAL